MAQMSPAEESLHDKRPRKKKKSKKARRKQSALAKFFNVLGELMITVGLVYLLFLGWAVWWTSLVLDRQQASAALDQSRQWMEQIDERAARAVPEGGIYGSDVNASSIPVMIEPADYEAFAVIYIPRLGADWKRIIRQTVDVEKVLNSYNAGIGHYKGTQMPGEVGNFAIAGHDSGWGNTFIDLSKLHVGDRMYVQTRDGWYIYSFVNFEYVQPSAVQVLLPTPRVPNVQPIDRIMTITTCNPPYNAGERLIAYNLFEKYYPLHEVPEAVAAIVQGG